LNHAVAVRLTSKQISLIWPGLDFVVKAEVTRRKHRVSSSCYPFQLYPPSPGFNRGTMDSEMMGIVIGLWRKLRLKQTRGGRQRLNSIELRAAMFAVRVTLALKRLDRHRKRKLGLEAKARFEVDSRSVKQFRDAGRRTIRSLERHMKRANRALLVTLTKAEYQALMQVWHEHLRWMRLHLAYSKPLPPIVKGKKKRQQEILDILVDIAADGLKKEGYVPPEPRELRRVLRLYVHSSNRGREGVNSYRFLLRYPNHVDTKWFLVRWVLSRTKVERAR